MYLYSKLISQVFQKVITSAQGELALEEFLSGSREYWETLQLELILYQDKCQLINNWAALFAKLNEDTSSIAHMKQSPFFTVQKLSYEANHQAFAEETALWESKLSSLYCLFELWSHVQRRWVYLEGIFSGSVDIKQLLPKESAHFLEINNTFITTMRRVALTHSAIDVLYIEGIQVTFERLNLLLDNVQKVHTNTSVAHLTGAW